MEATRINRTYLKDDKRIPEDYIFCDRCNKDEKQIDKPLCIACEKYIHLYNIICPTCEIEKIYYENYNKETKTFYKTKFYYYTINFCNKCEDDPRNKLGEPIDDEIDGKIIPFYCN
jgi:hypothetical protein